jgi:hypothetical protein
MFNFSATGEDVIQSESLAAKPVRPEKERKHRALSRDSKIKEFAEKCQVSLFIWSTKTFLLANEKKGRPEIRF